MEWEKPYLTSAEKDLFEKRHQKRLILRQQFIKENYSPYNHMKGEGGFLYDPAIYRFGAMRVSYFEHFRPNITSFLIGYTFIILPTMLYCYLLYSQRSRNEKSIRNGNVSYRDRKFKFI